MPDAKIAAKRSLALLFSMLRSPLARDVVLLYHSIGDGPLALPQRAFADQMDWLHATGTVVPLMDLLTTDARQRSRVAITFDDGYRGLHRFAMPILVGSPAMPAAFLTTGWIGVAERRASAPEHGHYPGEQFLLWQEVEDLAAAGWRIGAHGVEHLDLTVQPGDRIDVELRASRSAIETKLGSVLPVFAYTWGRHTARLRAHVAEASYSYALAGAHGPVTERSDRFAIPRIDVARKYSLDDFKAIVRGDWDYLGWYQRARLAWRTGYSVPGLGRSSRS